MHGLMYNEYMGGYGTKAGAAKNEWIDYVKKKRAKKYPWLSYQEALSFEPIQRRWKEKKKVLLVLRDVK